MGWKEARVWALLFFFFFLSFPHLNLMTLLTIPPAIFEIPSPGGTLGAGLAAREAVVAAGGHGLSIPSLSSFDARLKGAAMSELWQRFGTRKCCVTFTTLTIGLHPS